MMAQIRPLTDLKMFKFDVLHVHVWKVLLWDWFHCVLKRLELLKMLKGEGSCVKTGEFHLLFVLFIPSYVSKLRCTICLSSDSSLDRGSIWQMKSVHDKLMQHSSPEPAPPEPHLKYIHCFTFLSVSPFRCSIALFKSTISLTHRTRDELPPPWLDSILCYCVTSVNLNLLKSISSMQVAADKCALTHRTLALHCCWPSCRTSSVCSLPGRLWWR